MGQNLMDSGGTINVETQQLTNCMTQSGCVAFTIEEMPNSLCSNQYGCEYRVCMTLDFVSQKCAAKPNNGFIDAEGYTCPKKSNVCADNGFLGFESATKTSSPDILKNGYRQCQVAGPNQRVEFLLKDGDCSANNGGKASVQIPGSDFPVE